MQTMGKFKQKPPIFHKIYANYYKIYAKIGKKWENLCKSL